MRVFVLGGRLQGTEAVYLAAKAGYETLLMDRSPAPPAAGLAGRHVVGDITADERASRSLARTCDVILPACEDEATLEWLTERAPRWGVPLLFDMAAWRVTRSKAASRRLFASLGVARPDPWPACGFPVVVKPDGASGSYGVSMAHDEPALTATQHGAGRRRPRGRRRGVPERAVALTRGPWVERPWSAPPGHRTRVRQRL